MQASLYAETYAAWQADPDAFWREAAREIDWVSQPKVVHDQNAGVHGHWFPDATCNTCFNAVDRHVNAGHGDRAALIFDSPVTGAKHSFTYAQLLGEVATLRALGFPRSWIVANLLCESALLVGAGGIAALPLGGVLAIGLDRILRRMPGVPERLHFFVFEPRTVVLHVVLLGATALVASAYPIWLAARLPIAATLRQELVS